MPEEPSPSESTTHRAAEVIPSTPPEWAPWLCLIPIGTTILYYRLPAAWQALRLIQFLPQILAYLAFGCWLVRNDAASARLGLTRSLRAEGLRWGLRVGLALGFINISVILWIIPWSGQDIAFLREPPHARIPVFVMLPWFIGLIACFVEINFRGFLLGRLVALFTRVFPHASRFTLHTLAIGLSALAFSFDPFLVVTFRHLHWIAVWDGIVWGVLWLRLRNLYAPIVAHAVEVIVMYSIIKMALG